MKITFLGTGPPEGMPIISCSCKWCRSVENSRLRPCVLVQTEKTSIILDLGPDIRSQLIYCYNNGIKKIDGIFVTHAHFDHIWGIGEIEQLQWINKTIPIYSNDSTSKYVRRFIPWISEEIKIMDDYSDNKLKDMKIIPIPIIHSQREELKTSGYVIKYKKQKLVYIPDIRDLPKDALNLVSKPDVLIIDGQYILGKYIKDEDHAGGQELLEIISKIEAKKVFLMAFSEHWYKISAKSAEAKLPKGYNISKDNQSIKI